MPVPPEKILLVDDEPRLLAGLRRRMSMDFNIITAERGAKALELIAEHDDIGVIVADMKMPEMNGIELLKRVRAEAPDIRRIMLTGNSDEETAIAAVNEGQVMRFLRKPCEADVLKEAISHALSDYQFARQKAAEAGDQLADNVPAEAARDAFLAMMNHELRTPLNHIIGLAHVLEGDHGGVSNNDADSIALLSQIRESGSDMLLLVNRMLEFARLRSEQSNEKPSAFDLIACLQWEINALRPKLKAKRITISLDSLRRHVDVFAHKPEITIAMRELLSNALKFNRPNGHISVMVKTGPDCVLVRVADTGVGIPEAVLKDVCEPFKQGDSSLSREHDGIGLGLALVSTVAKANHGSLEITSNDAAGTSVVMSLPRAEENVARVA
ncbi:hybrid sensor histidine kinase/response regulator [Parvularcula sp. IMCC14364]|uniref:hybrid sensor histidine kinase/response regulator n=1 Tax=Parvularcula sp. IMCC14364 TaxID=3067902 RepID=UPI00274102C2|nr:hybrid sensor histidine kinase/response regulator [Parvularcula sp. IMCC14364]